MLRPMEQEYLRRNPGVTVTSRTRSGEQYIPPGHPFSRLGAALGRQALAARQLQFGPTDTVRSVSVTKSERLNKLQKEQKKEPKKVDPVKRKTPSRGRTILDPLSGKNEGSTYKKKLLGD